MIAPFMRLAIYTDYAYHSIDGQIYAERAFAIFLSRLAPQFESLALIGRLTPEPSGARYPLGEQVEFVPLPYYRKLSQPVPVMKALAGSIRRYWRALDDVDCVWLLGPHPFAIVFAALAKLRRKQVALGVRQDLPEYVRNRHPHKRLLRFTAGALEFAFRTLGRSCSVIAVGPKLAHNYRRARRLLRLTVSLVDEDEVVSPASRQSDYSGKLRILSVGRLDPEKNPLLLADVLALLDRDEPGRWELVVCGEGSMSSQLEERLSELGVRERANLEGYVSHSSLRQMYSQCQLLLHVSWTEGLPQVLFEAFAAALPVTATDVGGVAEATDGAISLIPAGDAEAAAKALRKLAGNQALREQRVLAGHAIVEASTIQAEVSRLAEFLSSA